MNVVASNGAKRPFADGVQKGKPKVALIFGKDAFFSLGVANKLVPELLASGVEPVLVYADHKPVTPDTLPELQQYAFFDRILLHETVYPFLNDKNNKLEGKNGSARRMGFHDVLSTPQQIANQHDLILIESVPNVNDPNFANDLLGINNLRGIVNIRGIQIFKQPIIDRMHGKGVFFWNVHPGLLPDYKGVLPVMRTMVRKAREFEPQRAAAIKNSATLHNIDYGIDTGSILAHSSCDLDMHATVLENYINLVRPASDLVTSIVGPKLKNVSIPSQQQDRTQGSYYTYPTANELKEVETYGIRLLPDPERMIDLYVQSFTAPDTPAEAMLRSVLKEAVDSGLDRIAKGTFCQPSASSRAPTLTAPVGGGPVASPAPAGA